MRWVALAALAVLKSGNHIDMLINDTNVVNAIVLSAMEDEIQYTDVLNGCFPKSKQSEKGCGYTILQSSLEHYLSFKERTGVIFESAHPYADNTEAVYEVNVLPDSCGMEIIFSAQSATEQNCDYVRFHNGTILLPYNDNFTANNAKLIGPDKLSGRLGSNNFPTETTSLYLPVNRTHMNFFSDGSQNDW